MTLFAEAHGVLELSSGFTLYHNPFEGRQMYNYNYVGRLLALPHNGSVFISITLMLWRKSPSIRCWPKEHVRNLHPILAIPTGKKGF